PGIATTYSGGTLELSIGDYKLFSGASINLVNNTPGFAHDIFQLRTDFATDDFTNGATTYPLGTTDWRLTLDDPAFAVPGELFTSPGLPAIFPPGNPFLMTMEIDPGAFSGPSHSSVPFQPITMEIDNLIQLNGVVDSSPADTSAGLHYAYDFNNDGTFD